MRRFTIFGCSLLYLGASALGIYELTAKSPQLLGTPLPRWQSTCQVENSTPWQQPTGILAVDKLLHETQEAARFYRLV